MKRKEIAAVIEQVGIVPAIRVLSADDAHLVKHHPKLIVGAGTVLDVETARQCADAGAHFLTAPGFDCDIATFAAEHDMVSMPGALTPTEVVTAWRAGADFVKVFPAVQVGGDGYVRALNRSLPQVSLIASGGVNQQNAEAFILAGATAIGVGTQLIPTESIEKRQAKRIHELALRFSKFVREARLRLPPRKEVTASASHISAVKCEKP